MSWNEHGDLVFDLPKGYDFEECKGWTKDCGGKLDYDPIALSYNCRVYSDGDYICTLSFGGTPLKKTPVLEGGTVENAKAAVELWVKETQAEILKKLEGND